MELVEAMRPDWYEALSDADTPSTASKKRLSKSLASSRAYIAACLRRHKESQVRPRTHIALVLNGIVLTELF